MSTTRHYMDAEGPDSDAARAAVIWLVQGAVREGGGLLVVPSKAQLESGVLVSVLGGAVCKELAKNRTVPIEGTAYIEAITARTRPGRWRAGPVLVAYPDRGLLDVVDSLPGASAVLVLPWLRETVAPWARQWGAKPLGGGAAPITSPMSQRVTEALQRLTDVVNLSTGISHPMDKASAVRTLTDLRDEGELLDPQTIREWLVGQGRWRPQDADRVADLAARIRDRRPVRRR